MIILRFGKLGRVHISRPTDLELTALAFVLLFLLALFCLWK
jgi:hypothetical protein